MDPKPIDELVHYHATERTESLVDVEEPPNNVAYFMRERYKKLIEDHTMLIILPVIFSFTTAITLACSMIFSSELIHITYPGTPRGEGFSHPAFSFNTLVLCLLWFVYFIVALFHVNPKWIYPKGKMCIPISYVYKVLSVLIIIMGIISLITYGFLMYQVLAILIGETASVSTVYALIYNAVIMIAYTISMLVTFILYIRNISEIYKYTHEVHLVLAPILIENHLGELKGGKFDVVDIERIKKDALTAIIEGMGDGPKEIMYKNITHIRSTMQTSKIPRHIATPVSKEIEMMSLLED